MKAVADPVSLDQLADKKRLPVIPAGVAELISALSDESKGYRELADQIERFPTITARLIALVNSAWSNPATHITSLEQTCARLGLRIVRSVSISLAISDTFNPNRCPTFDSVYYWSDALLVADIASILVDTSGPPYQVDRGIVRSAALLHNLGLLFLVHHYPRQLDQSLLVYAQDRDHALNKIIKQQLGISPAQAGSFLANNWGLPEPIQITMSFYDDADYDEANWPLVATVALAIDCVSRLNREQEPTGDLLSVARGLFTDEGQIVELWPQFKRLQASTRELAQVVFS
ncbi:MAG: HDOD domain-containing protein [Gammaproteobacteria bacterium]|nr:HDOD domain-containing protein [Gammaproteobacteria bacterium]